MTIRMAGFIPVLIFLLGLAAGEISPGVHVVWLIYTMTLLGYIYFWSKHLMGKLKLLLKEPVSEASLEKQFRFVFLEGEHIEQYIGKIGRKMQAAQAQMISQKAHHAGENLNHLLSNTTDPLTGVANRREMERYLDKLLSRENMVAIIMLDIDHFKKVNDTYGHDAGDLVLKQFAVTVRNAIRPQDYLCRYGGEEFMVICTADIQETCQIAQRIRTGIEASLMQVSDSNFISITTSLGVAQHNPGEGRQEVMKRADMALYAAKQKGRNRVERGVDEQKCAG